MFSCAWGPLWPLGKRLFESFARFPGCFPCQEAASLTVSPPVNTGLLWCLAPALDLGLCTGVAG